MRRAEQRICGTAVGRVRICIRAAVRSHADRRGVFDGRPCHLPARLSCRQEEARGIHPRSLSAKRARLTATYYLYDYFYFSKRIFFPESHPRMRANLPLFSLRGKRLACVVRR